MTPRTIEDRLREEYCSLSPDIKRVMHQLRADVTHLLLPVTLDLDHHERVQIDGRVKECDSAIASLLRRQESRKFDDNKPSQYSLTSLPDLAGLRVMIFPRLLLKEVHTTLLMKYGNWVSDPVISAAPARLLAWKYHGFCTASPEIRAEIQIMPLLTGMFWHVEHGAFYKPRDKTLEGIARTPLITTLVDHVYTAFDDLENVLEQKLHSKVAPNPPITHSPL